MGRLIDREYLVTLDFTETLLGSRPTASIAARWVREQEKDKLERELRAGRRPVPVVAGDEGMLAKATAEEAEALAEERVAGSTGDEGQEGNELAVTGFSSDPATGRLHLWDFQLMGYLKSVAQTLAVKIPGQRVEAVSALTQIQRLVWVFGADSEDPMERRLYLTRDGEFLTEPEPELMDRPLRAMTAQGERVSIAISEQLHPPCQCRARIVLLRGCKLKTEQLEEVLAYGMFQGLGQWRSGGWGRFQASLEQVR